MLLYIDLYVRKDILTNKILKLNFLQHGQDISNCILRIFNLLKINNFIINNILHHYQIF